MNRYARNAFCAARVYPHIRWGIGNWDSQLLHCSSLLGPVQNGRDQLSPLGPLGLLEYFFTERGDTWAGGDWSRFTYTPAYQSSAQW